MSGFGLGLGFPLDPRGVFAAGLPFGLLCREALGGLVRPREQLVQPRRPVVLRGLRRCGLDLRAGLRRTRDPVRGADGGSAGYALGRPGLSGVDGGLVLAGDGAFDGFDVRLELAPPSDHRLRLVLWAAACCSGRRLGVPAPLKFGPGFPGCFPPGRVPAAHCSYRALPASSRCRLGGDAAGEGVGAGRAGLVVPGLGVGGLLAARRLRPGR